VDENLKGLIKDEETEIGIDKTFHHSMHEFLMFSISVISYDVKNSIYIILKDRGENLNTSRISFAVFIKKVQITTRSQRSHKIKPTSHLNYFAYSVIYCKLNTVKYCSPVKIITRISLN